MCETMNRITMHVPGWAGGDDPNYKPVVEEFNTTEELLAIEWVKKWKKFKEEGLPFFRYVKNSNHLIAEFGEGEIWWVLGYLRDSATVELPEWQIPSCQCGHDAMAHQGYSPKKFDCKLCSCTRFKGEKKNEK